MSVLSLEWPLWMLGAITGQWLLPQQLARLWLIALAAAFLAIYSPASAAILVTFTLATYYLAQSRRHLGSRIVLVGFLIVAVLVWFKAKIAADMASGVLGIAIPLGLSYYALRCIHYLVERYKGRLAPHDFGDFVSYLFFLPTLIAGPIHRFNEFQRDQRRMRWDSEKFSEGLERVLYGYVKITFLANYVISMRLAGSIAALGPEQAALAAYLTMLKQGLNGYLQFSGYSDVAIGCGLLLGYRVIENFRWPLLQKNISEFWKAWHISLSSWCREYVYMLVVSFTRRPALAVLATMLAIGLWHEVSLRYILWGAYNGLGIVLWQQFQRVKRWVPEWPFRQTGWYRIAAHGLAVVVTFHFVMFGFVLVLQPTIAAAIAFYRAMLPGH
jgi:D-alanyl-lipoteichoic acid acyltransferase DltB (MBOAT superfamily)